MTLCKKHTIALFVIAVVLLSGCRQEMELAGYNYFYTIKTTDNDQSYSLCNDQVQSLGIKTSTIIDTMGYENVTKGTELYVNDGLVINDNSYYTGGLSTTIAYYDLSVQHSYKYEDACSAFVEINGVRKFFSLPGKSKGILIINEEDDIYFLFKSTQAESEFTTETYYVSKNGEEPTLIAENHQEIYSLRNAEIKKFKKFGDKFYFVGVKDKVAFFCEASQIKTPFYLSDYGGCAYDLAMKDSVIYECGQNQNKAILWKGQEPYELPVPEGTQESVATCISVVGNDVYVGGRIDEEPAIWKNGELLATYTEFPPVWSGYYVTGVDNSSYTNDLNRPITEEFGWVCAMEIDGDNIYSIVETSNWVSDNKRFVLKWQIGDKVTFDYDYDLVEMLRNGQIKLDDSYYGRDKLGHTTWERTAYGTPHIIPYYVKTKAKRKK